MNEDLSKHDEIIAEAREKYTVHHCGECEFRKSCYNKFDSDKCKNTRQSIMLGFGIEDGWFSKLLDRLEAANKREATCEKSSIVGNNAMMHETLEKISKIAWDKRRHTKEEREVHRSPEPSGNGAKIRETDDWLIQLVSLINGEISHYMSQGADCFSVDCGSWHIQYDKTKGGAE